jgi:hypothetical protein
MLWSTLTSIKALPSKYELGRKSLNGVLPLFRSEQPQLWEATTNQTKVHPLICRKRRDKGQTSPIH